MTSFTVKQQQRELLLARRRARPEPERADARARTAQHLLDAVAAVARPVGLGPDQPSPSPMTIAAYLPLPSEPMAPGLPAVLARRGFRVLVPVARPGAALDWCRYRADASNLDDGADAPGAVVGPLGIVEPSGPRLGAAAIADVDVVLVPALAVDDRGTRLGRGGGHYDRSLALLAARGPRSAGRPAPRLVAVIFDDERLAELPREPHDIPVTDVVSPIDGWRHIAPVLRN